MSRGVSIEVVPEGHHIQAVEWVLNQIGPLSPEAMNRLALKVLHNHYLKGLQGGFRYPDPDKHYREIIGQFDHPDDSTLILTRSSGYGTNRDGTWPREWVPFDRLVVAYNGPFEKVDGFHYDRPLDLAKLEDQRRMVSLLKVVRSALLA